MAKFGMSMCVLGLSAELKADGIAVNALWPRTTIATAAIANIVGGADMMFTSRKPDIMADASYQIFTSPSRELTGQFLIDDTFLVSRGLTDLDQYRADPTRDLTPDFFVPADSVPPQSLKAVA